MRTRLTTILALTTASVVVGACGLPIPGRGSDGGSGSATEARSGAFSVEIPEGFTVKDIADQPETIEVAAARNDDKDQIIVSRYEGDTTSDNEGLHVVTSNVTQYQLDCKPQQDTLGGSKAWRCTGEYEGHSFDKVFVSVSGEGQSALVLAQAGQGQGEGIARDVVSSLTWR